jgi:molybdate transport system ATP-binding protein
LHRHAPEGTPRNVWRTTAAEVDWEGERVRVRLGGPLPLVAEVTPGAIAALAIGVGDEVWVSVKATEINVFGS